MHGDILDRCAGKSKQRMLEIQKQGLKAVQKEVSRRGSRASFAYAHVGYSSLGKMSKFMLNTANVKPEKLQALCA